MPWLAALIVAALVALGLRSRQRRTLLFEKKRRNEWCIVIVHEHSGSVLIDPPLLDVGTEPGRKINWLVFGECKDESCKGDYKIIVGEFSPSDPFDENLDNGRKRKLEGKVPKTQKGADERLEAKVKASISGKVQFTYRISVTKEGQEGEIAGANGVLRVCPVWPCD